MFADINVEALRRTTTCRSTQLDWITAKSKHQIYLVDAAQSVRPADLRTLSPR